MTRAIQYQHFGGPEVLEIWPELNKTVFWGGFCGVPG